MFGYLFSMLKLIQLLSLTLQKIYWEFSLHTEHQEQKLLHKEAAVSDL